MNPGAMLQSPIKSPAPRATIRTPGSPSSSRLSLRGPAGSPLPATSPRRLARLDASSGTVVIWGDGWERSSSPVKDTGAFRKPCSAFETSSSHLMHPLVDEDEDLSATPRPHADRVSEHVGFTRPKEDREFVGCKMLSLCGGFGKLALITQDGGLVESGASEPDQESMPFSAPPGASICQMVAGQKHYLVLCSDGLVYGSGHNTYGQLGSTGLLTKPLYY